MNISALVQEQQTYFRSGATLPPAQRRKALQALLAELDRREPQLLQALKQDLNKAPFEGYMTELGMIKEELHFHLRHLDGWCKPRRVPTPISQFPARSIRQPEPYGVTLVMAPWNYPLQLSLVPMIGALSAGNCVILKPSAYAPACSQALAELIAACLPRELAAGRKTRLCWSSPLTSSSSPAAPLWAATSWRWPPATSPLWCWSWVARAR